MCADFLGFGPEFLFEGQRGAFGGAVLANAVIPAPALHEFVMVFGGFAPAGLAFENTHFMPRDMVLLYSATISRKMQLVKQRLEHF
ncbi:hypothetical protein SDC9_109759 [bioreactor metagenome]|uniref:Uncharacterized protein n=1 Tax=bioreactor metagenome TaxID=1076179 RepID=A0A645BE08_9ZZZZ